MKGATLARMSREAKARWEALPESEKTRITEKRRAWYREHKPWRTPLYEAMKGAHPNPSPCPDCGGPGRMQLAFDDEAQTVEFVGWRCYPCRKAQA